MKPEYLMLGHVYKPGKVSPAGWFVSEKLDGVRAFWDGGISRGMLAKDVPYANTIKDVNPQVATGLWSRTGKVIHASDYWLNRLPNFPLDGELFLGRGQFQETYSTISRYTPDSRWQKIQYKIFDSPSLATFLRPRTIKVRDYHFSVGNWSWFLDKSVGKVESTKETWTFEWVWYWLNKKKIENEVVQLTEQRLLPFDHFAAIEKMNDYLNAIVGKGGEGIILRKAVSFWVSERSHSLLKFKPFLDSEGVVIGFKGGEGKYEGMMGSLILKSENGSIFKISGFTNSERMFSKSLEPGAEIFENCGSIFRIGDKVTYKYRELSDDGVPKEPRYWRKA